MVPRLSEATQPLPMQVLYEEENGAEGEQYIEIMVEIMKSESTIKGTLGSSHKHIFNKM